MYAQDLFASIAAVDLGPISKQLMHAELGEGWSPAHTDEVEGEYRRFLHLLKMFPHAQVAPSADVDVFWHYHILDTRKYATDCELVFGYFLHHCPSDEVEGEVATSFHRATSARMEALYAATFGEPYLRARGGADAAGAAQSAWCTPALPKAAWCTPSAPKAAWCTPSAPKAAWCTPSAPKAAWCTPSAPKAAWCTPSAPTAAWCTPSRPGAIVAAQPPVALNDASYLSADLAEAV